MALFSRYSGEGAS